MQEFYHSIPKLYNKNIKVTPGGISEVMSEMVEMVEVR